MSFFKEVSKPSTTTVRDRLRQKRLAHEQAQKDAGIWGDMTVGEIKRENKVFVHHWKGSGKTDLLALSGKRPREMTVLEHEALVAWLKSGAYDGFSHTLIAWNINEAEALRVKSECVEKYLSSGTQVVNPT